MARTKRKIQLSPKDLYRTPQWCIDILARVIKESCPMPDWIGDLGAADGRIGLTIANQFSIAKHFPLMWFVDLQLDKHLKSQAGKHIYCDEGNLAKIEPPKAVKGRRVIFASNPPFSNALGFVDWAVRRIADYPEGSMAVFLLKKDWFGTKGRALWLNQHPSNRIVGLTPRPSFVGGGTDFGEYCWAFWFNGKMSRVFWPEEIRLKGI